MFDIGFSELLLFGAIALIVLGPEKLPHAARTAGRWYGKLRRAATTLKSEIEAELDLAETRQLMQQELAKIRQTEAQMQEEMAAMRGSMASLRSAQDQALSTALVADENQDTSQAHPSMSAKTVASDTQSTNIAASNAIPLAMTGSSDFDADANGAAGQPDPAALTRPWQNMWFRLSAYDKAWRLPAPPYLPNYQADVLLNAPALSNLPHLPHATQPPAKGTPSTSSTSIAKQETSSWL